MQLPEIHAAHRAGQPLRIRQAVLNRQLHIRVAHLGQNAAVGELDLHLVLDDKAGLLVGNTAGHDP